MNIEFPKTNVVGCKFTYRNSTVARGAVYDDFDRLVDANQSKTYYYELPEGLEVSVGESVVVHCVNGFAVCEVCEVNALVDLPRLDFVVDKINMGNYRSVIAAEKQRQMLKAKIEHERKRLESMVTYDLLAEKVPEFKALLDTYRSLGGKF